MIERKMFDQQITSIKQKYQRICQPNSKDLSPLQYYTQPHSNHYLYTTPIKQNKANHEELTYSGNKLEPVQPNLPISHPTKQETQIQKVNRRLSSKKEQKMDQPHPDRVCLTSRNSENRNKVEEFVMEKQKIIKKRMEENERLLRKSKELRNQEFRKHSQPKDANNHHPQLANIQSQLPAKNKNKEHPVKENVSPGVLQPKNINRKVESSASKFKSTMDELSEKTKALFSEKMNQVLLNSNLKDIKSKEVALYEPKVQVKREKKVERNMVSFMKGDVQNEETKELKSVNAFQNTTKIQERIKALLSYH